MNEFKDSLLLAADFNPVSLQAPDAWVGHLPFAAWLMKTLRPSVFVELGTHSGNSYFSFCQAAREADINVKCYAVDTWQGDEHAGNYSNEVYEQVNTHNQAFYGGFSRLLRMTFDDAASYFSAGSVDLLHIDGLHTYEAVKHDFDTWLPKLAPGAIVLFHDINVRERGFGVWQLWEELQQRYAEHHEFVHSHGLGVLRIGGGEAAALPWLRAGGAEQQLLRNYFAALGARQQERFEAQQSRQQLASARQQIAERDALITHLHEVVAEHSGNLHIANVALAERDKLVQHLHEVVAEHSGNLHIANVALAERDVQLSDMHAELAQMHAAQAGMAEREEQLQKVTAELSAARLAIASRDEKALAAWQALHE